MNNALSASVANAPEQLSKILMETAEIFWNDAAICRSSWQDDTADLVWEKLGYELERSAARCEKIVATYFR